MNWRERRRDRLNRLPEWMRSIRFRLAILYSAVLFGVATLLVVLIYFGVSWKLTQQPVTRRLEVQGFLLRPDGTITVDRTDFVDVAAFEAAVNESTLDQLRTLSLLALAGLFLISLLVGWVISGRVLAPIGRITNIARQIQATDLSRRIDLVGADDELKRLADTFDDMLNRIDAAFLAQRRFIADASHELRNPLAIIRTNLDVATAGELDEEEQIRTLGAIRRASDRMARLVDDLLLLARQEAPKELRSDFDLAELMREATDEYMAAAAERGVGLERSLCSGVIVHADRDALKRAVANLIENAIRLAPGGSRIATGTGERAGWAWIGVADQGPGIAPEHQDAIFDRFYRADAGRSRRDGGSGLGLAIVRRIVDSHGGEVAVWSEIGEGSTFVVWLPTAGGQRSPAPPDELPTLLPRLPA